MPIPKPRDFAGGAARERRLRKLHEAAGQDLARARKLCDEPLPLPTSEHKWDPAEKEWERFLRGISP